MNGLLTLAVIFLQLSILAVGGIATVLPEMQRQVTEVHGYMDRQTFTTLFAMAQAAPGPNMMVSTLIGLHVAGIPGALVATIALVGPSSVLTFVTARLWHRLREKPWRNAVQAGLVPVTVGLVASSAALLTETTTHDLLSAAITVATAVTLLGTRLHPLWLLGAGVLVALA